MQQDDKAANKQPRAINRFLWMLFVVGIILFLDPFYLVDRYGFRSQYYSLNNIEAVEAGKIKNGYMLREGYECAGSVRSYPSLLFGVSSVPFCMSQHAYCPIPGQEGTKKFNDLHLIGLRLYKCACPSDVTAKNQADCHSQSTAAHNYAEWRWVGFVIDVTKLF